MAFTGSCAAIADGKLPTVQIGPRFNSDLNGAPYRFLRTFPKDYDVGTTTTYPVLIFLHGSGEAGLDIEVIKKHGPPKLIAEGQDLPFITISPQLETHSAWNEARLEATLVNAVDGLNIDKSRIYLTGLSLGGHGTWAWAAKRPNLFAAIAPIAGSGRTNTGCELKNMPVWAFHGAKDDAVPVRGSTRMARAIRACGGNPRLTIYPEEGHWSWVPAYNSQELYSWLLAQSNPNGAAEFDKLKLQAQ